VGTRLLRAVLLSVLTGLLLAGAAFPVIGGVGLMAHGGARTFNDLPQELEETPLPQRSRILARDGSLLAEVFFNEDRVIVPLERVPAVARAAVIAVEDERFYDHPGVDLRGLVRAMVTNSQAGTVEEGGSTITQQYVKNVLLQAAGDDAAKRRATERSVARKVREARYAVALERRYSKDEILERYLNIAYYGQGVYGIGTAAAHYFSVPVEKLTLPQAALLAGLVQSPTRYDPRTQPKAALARRNAVLDRMLATGAVDAKAHAAARTSPLGLRLRRSVGGIEDNPLAPYFLEHVRETILDGTDPRLDEVFGTTPAQRAQRLFQGGLTIRTTLDPRLQQVASASLREQLGEKDDPASAVVVVQPGSGEIRVMAGLNHEARTRKVNLATGGEFGFQAGSTMKPFVLAAAIEQGIPLSFTRPSPARYRSRVFSDVVDGRIKPYEVGNAGDSQAGVFDVVRGTWQSVNTFYLQLEERTGVSHPVELARRMGVETFPLEEVPSFVLGSKEVSPLDMASAYATFAAQGTYCTPLAITSVEGPDGEQLAQLTPRCRRALEVEVADTVTSVLEGVIRNGTGRPASIGRPAAGKTGTTNGPAAAWFDGYTPDFAAVVWVGHPTDPTKRPLRNVNGVRIVYGGTFPARIWRTVMSAAHEGLPVRDFALPMAQPRPVMVRRPPQPSAGPSLPPPPDPAGKRPDEGRGKDKGRPEPSPDPDGD
jgi:membrane peptidoglycan carboxypeptidase